MRTAILALVLITAPAVAQDAAVDTSIQFGFGGDDPIEVKADKATYQGSTTILEDGVVVKQNDTTVSADRMDIFREEAETNTIAGSLKLGALQRIVATGNFRFDNVDNTVTGDKGTYYAARDVFIVEGNVVLTQPGGSSVRGNRLVYNLTTRSARFGTACETGTAGANANCGRVRIVLE